MFCFETPCNIVVLVAGISRLHVPPADPFVLPQLTVDRDLENLRVHAKIANLRIYGIPHFVVESLK